jgi:hypothetical protein
LQHITTILAFTSLCLSFPTVKETPLSTIHYGLYVLVQIAFIRLINVNHHTSRTSSTLVLLFWPAYTLISAVRIRTLVLTGHMSRDMSHTVNGRLTIARESLWLASAAFGLSVFILELYSPEKQWKSWSREGKIRLEDDEERDTVAGPDGVVYGKNEYGEAESPVVSANIYERLTFSWLTRKYPSYRSACPNNGS